MKNKVYICIDLKSFYASVECKERGLDPLKTNLVVADKSRTEKTICLAVSPSLKSYGVSGRARLFEVIQRVKQINYERRRKAKNYTFSGKSYNDDELKDNPSLELDYIIAPPRMSYYMDYSTRIYNVYLKYIAPEDIYVYSIDEVFCDITNYLNTYHISPRELVTKMIKDVYDTTGITATAGIGTNLFIAKVAMDVVAKHQEPNEFGVRIAELDEMSYRKEIWNHKPITDVWRVGKGIAEKLEKNRIYTMGDIARCSLQNENLLYKLFGVNAELLIDHAWGYEPCTIESIKAYKPSTNSLSSGQVLHCPYDYKKTKLIIKEMADLIALDLVEKGLMTNQITLTINYDIENLTNVNIREKYAGEITLDHYGREVPKHSHGTYNFETYTSSSKKIIDGFLKLYEKIANPLLLVRKINISVNKLEKKEKIDIRPKFKQIDLFSNITEKDFEEEIKDEENEMKVQKVMIDLKKRFGKNAILKGMNLEDGATTIDRNKQIGGHSE
ncbi:MAG: DNA methylase [Bacilli bacterium]|nr:DNA methylase [Bacilli bacterium]